MSIRVVLIASAFCLSVLSAEIGDFRNVDQDIGRTFGNWRQKRFIVQFQVPSPVGHFRVSMLPPFIQTMMSRLPSMFRRGIFLSGNQQQDASSTTPAVGTTIHDRDDDTTTVSGSGVRYQRLYYR